jgi:dedicated sortase system histidine kinase
LYVEIRDDTVVYTDRDTLESPDRNADHLIVESENRDGIRETFHFFAGAPGDIQPTRVTGGRRFDETRIAAHWEQTADGYRIEARIPRSVAGPRLGLTVFNTADALRAGVRSSSFAGDRPGRAVTISPVLQSFARGYEQPGWRLMITDAEGWRRAITGSVSMSGAADSPNAPRSGWLRLVYSIVLRPGEEAALAEPSPTGRETSHYIQEALDGNATSLWFRSPDTDRAVVAVARPIWSGNVQTGTIVLQQGTDAILSQTNAALARLIALTALATIVVAIVLIGYASWLSFRIRRLSEAAVRAVDDRQLQSALPSSLAGDEVGDLSRSFSSVLRQLGIYNEYLQSLAGKLSHELRTPLTIVRSSLENLDHEKLPAGALEYTERAREGTDRLQKILNAMSEASRTEQLIENVEPERFVPGNVLGSTVRAYADAWPGRQFRFEDASGQAEVDGSPELFIQMIDKLADNAVEFTGEGDVIRVSVTRDDGKIAVHVENPGPQLPEKMRSELFDSLVSVREGEPGHHLGLGLFIARLIAEGHGGTIEAANIDDGVRFTVRMPIAGD